MNPDTSVIICVYTEERWDDIVAAVESVRQQTTPPQEIIIVVDHNEILRDRIQAHMQDVVVINNRGEQGLSHARNSGLAVAKGQMIAFLDDDARAEANWLEILSNHCKQPNVMGAGGRILPLWSGEKVRWLPEEFYWTIGCTYRGMPTTIKPIRNLIGASMCLRREAFDAVGNFHTGMGRVNTIPLGCEETELCIRIRQNRPEHELIYDPGAVVLHRVTKPRTYWRYFRSRCYNEGLSKAMVSQLVGSSDALSSERSYIFRTLPQGVFQGVKDAVMRQDVYGLARSGAIIAGLAITIFGYGVGKLKLLTNRN